MIDQINELPEDGWKSSDETLRYRENTRICRKIKLSCTFLHLIDILHDLILKLTQCITVMDVIGMGTHV